ncbi:hypothetical protein MKW98_007116 [Papaver atlanticum]|uniref:Uncharacterized protein n=1 Tax=Papaver atlanticum TaxID=357466 RepID=A0AAD4SLD5_9MAGN|nr:hypothetical protein MKW98_007116 [Papaver atlanticum]
MEVGLMTVFVELGSVVLVALQAHKRLLSYFIRKPELELGRVGKVQQKKKVRFADDVIEPSSNNKEYRKQQRSRSNVMYGTIKFGDVIVPCQIILDEELENKMPENRRALTKELLR